MTPSLSGNDMGKAFEKHDAVREKYEKALKAYNECKKKHQQE